jgi:ABC-type ATPase with predicted acetyltransferase domain
MHADPVRIEVEASMRTAVRPSRRVCEVAAMFGLGVDERRTVQLVPRTTLTLGPGRVVFVTGASGGGKSTLLRLIGRELRTRAGSKVIEFDGLGEPADRPLVELFEDGPLDEALRWLSLAGINDAFVMLRRPAELSDGQRYRLRLARAMAATEEAASADGAVDGSGARCPKAVLADEFGATLDRPTAQVIARNARRWASRSGVCLVAATTHDDLLEALDPDTLIVQHPGERMEVLEKPETRSPQSE